jgi:hypothetical protein
VVHDDTTFLARYLTNVGFFDLFDPNARVEDPRAGSDVTRRLTRFLVRKLVGILIVTRAATGTLCRRVRVPYRSGRYHLTSVAPIRAASGAGARSRLARSAASCSGVGPRVPGKEAVSRESSPDS